MENFTLPMLEVDPNEVDPNKEDLDEEDPDEEDRDLNIVERKFKKWTLSKMSTQFNNWKKRLDKDLSRKKRLWCSLEPLRR
jgi:hypothetical protein